jgi:hypothetical protein
MRSGEKKFTKMMDLSEGFNSVSILLYIGSDVIRQCTVSKIGYHCDAEYNAKGEFARNNSQKQHTPVVVLTLGDERTLHMKKRKVGQNGSWTKSENEKVYDFLLSNGSLFVVDPDDEIPKTRGHQNQGLSQFQHGGFEVKKGLSIAIIFRTVTTMAKIHVTDNTMQLGKEDNDYLDERITPSGKQWKPRREHFDDAYNEALERKQDMEYQLRAYVKGAIEKGTLFNGQAK